MTLVKNEAATINHKLGALLQVAHASSSNMSEKSNASQMRPVWDYADATLILLGSDGKYIGSAGSK